MKEDLVKRIFNCIPSRNIEKDWGVEHATEAGILQPTAAIPNAKDLRDTSWWSIGNQESTGSCVGWASTDSVIRWHLVKANRIPKDKLLSVRFTWMASKETDEFTSVATTFIERAGTSLKAALDIARKFGVVEDSILPFASGKLYEGKPETFYMLAARLKISGYINIGNNLANWRNWLATNGPILTRLDVDNTWNNASANSANLDVYQRPALPAGHAVALVGYTPDRFIVRNSWGTNWGDKGFVYVSNAYAQAAFTEAYGVSV